MIKSYRILAFNSAYKILFFVLSVCIALFALIFSDEGLMLVACMLILVANILMGLNSYQRNIVFLCFEFTFFLFLMGRPIINILYNGNYGVEFNSKILLKCFWELYISQLFLLIGFSIPKINKNKRDNNYRSNIKASIYYYDDDIKLIGKIFTYLFYATTVFNIAETIIKLNVVKQYGYFGYYTVDNLIPVYISKISQANEYLFWGICASMRSKKSFFPAMIIYISEGVLATLIGQRSSVLLRVAFIIIYYVLRNRMESVWIGKKEKIFFIALLPIIFIFIVTYSYTRIGQSYSGKTILDSIYELFNGQGITFEILGYQQIYKDSAIMQQNFTFGELWTFLTQNVISKIFLNIPSYSQNTIKMAEFGHSFGQSISYLVLKSEYLAGRGYGSTYIAELAQDYSIFGIAIINLIYGFIMKHLQVNRNNSFVLNLFYCYMIVGLIYAPRSTAIGPFMNFFTYNALMVNILVWFIYKLIKEKRKRNV